MGKDRGKLELPGQDSVSKEIMASRRSRLCFCACVCFVSKDLSKSQEGSSLAHGSFCVLPSSFLPPSSWQKRSLGVTRDIRHVNADVSPSRTSQSWISERSPLKHS